MIDEVIYLINAVANTQVHILGESRGACLEVVMSRMKKRAKEQPIRFVAVSATVCSVPSEPC